MTFGRLERKPGERPFSDINITPLVDVMLVLVVILIVTAPLMAGSLRLDLPASEGPEQPASRPASVSVTLDAAGGLFLGEQPMSLEALVERLAAAARANPDTEVRLLADRSVPYGRVVEVMSVAQQAGLGRIGFVTEPKAR